MKLASGCFALLAVLVLARGAHAQDQDAFDLVDEIFADDAELAPADPGAQRSAIARALFEEGLACAREGRFVEAADAFSRAQSLRPAPGVAYNLASALMRIGRLVEASELLEWVVRHDDAGARMREAAHTTLEQLGGRLAHMRLVLAGPADDLVLLLDGAPLAHAVLGVDVPIDPGPHRIEAMRGDEHVLSRAIEIGEAAREDVELDVPLPRVEAPAPEPRRPPPPPPATQDLTWLAYTGAAVGVAILIVSVATAVALTGQPPQPIAGNTMPPFLEWE